MSERAVHDIGVIGGGPVGLSAALAAQRAGLHPVVFEARTEQVSRDPRVFALSHGSRLILERLGAWDDTLEPHPIRVVHVSQRGRFGHATLRADDLRVEALGYVVAYAKLLEALRRRAADAGVQVVTGARVTAIETRSDCAVVHHDLDGAPGQTRARVVAQADGGASLFARVRATEHDYQQCAVIAEVLCERTVPDHAYERFTGRGPIALLPVAGAHALIWTVPAAEAQQVVDLDDRQFEQALLEAYGERLGDVRLRGARASFRLKLSYAHRIIDDRHVLIGNAAQTLHPVAGQGFNIGLRDAFELAEALEQSGDRGGDLLEGLRRYRASRRFDRAGGTLFTDLLVRTFSNDDPLLAGARGLGLFLLDASGGARRFLMRRMIYGSPG